MNRLSAWVLTVLLAAPSLRLRAQEDLDAKLELREENGRHVFRVSGTSNLPAGTPLRVRIFAVESVPDRSGKLREDEEPLVTDDEDRPAARAFRAPSGTFSMGVHSFRRRPYSLHYRARIEAPGRAFAVELRAGSGADFEAELRARAAEAREDFLALDGVWIQMRRELARQSEHPDAETWHAWSTSWRSRIGESEARNLERFDLWCVMPERRAKMRLGAVAEYLRRTIDDQAAALDGDAERAARLRERLTRFAAYLDETRDDLGIDALDPEVFGPILARYERALAGLPATRGEALTALLECGPPLRDRRRPYALLSDLASSLARFLRSPGPEARESHARSLADFKSLAGLP
jgi:hypothetical protein